MTKEIEESSNISTENGSDELNDEDINTKRDKKYKKGIIYLSKVPPTMNVTQLTEFMARFGEVGRVYLMPKKRKPGDKKPAKHFTEGWVEFLKKKVAKQVAAQFNNCQIDCRKRSKHYDFIWNFKYLPRFKWIHLSEKLAYEKQAHRHKLRAEILEAKRESVYFSNNLDVADKINKRKSKNSKKEEIKQSSIKINKNNKKKMDDKIPVTDRKQFLTSLFS